MTPTPSDERVPNFLVVGAAKSGTTSLCHYLRQHPDIFVAREKESHFLLFEHDDPPRAGPGDDDAFVSLLIRDRERYLQCFSGVGERSAMRGEASVYYFCEPRAFVRALQLNPAMKFIAVLRDPVDRAFSAWSHMRRDEREPEPDFLAALDAEPQRTRAGWSYGFRYESVGRYAAQLEAARAVVPEGQLHVLLYDDLVERPDATFAALFAFLGVPYSSVDSSLVMNASGTPRLRALNRLMISNNPVKEALKKVLPYNLGHAMAHRLRNWNLEPLTLGDVDRRDLHERYAADIARLSLLLGRDLRRWRHGSTAVPGP